MSRQGSWSGLCLKPKSSIQSIDSDSDNHTDKDGQQSPRLSDFMPQRQRGGTVDGIRDHTRRDSDAMVDAGETQIAV